MAQIVSNFNYSAPEGIPEDMFGPSGVFARAVNLVHYGASELSPGDITIAAHGEYNPNPGYFLGWAFISEGSENWPKGENGLYLPAKEMREELLTRRDRIYEEMGRLGVEVDPSRFAIVEVNGVCPGLLAKNIVEIRQFKESNLPKQSDIHSLVSSEFDGIDTSIYTDYRNELSGSNADVELEVFPEENLYANGCAEEFNHKAKKLGERVLNSGINSVNIFVNGVKGAGWFNSQDA